MMSGTSTSGSGSPAFWAGGWLISGGVWENGARLLRLTLNELPAPLWVGLSNEIEDDVRGFPLLLLLIRLPSSGVD
jgi:hypothetical protein